MRSSARRAGAAILVFAAGIVSAQVQYRPNREFRSLNTDSYELAIQENGEIDVSLASGEPIFIDAFPMVWLDGQDAPQTLPIDGDWSGRFPVNDPLGQGNGMVLRKKECTWSVRTYPTKPFFVVQVAYENISKNPVAIRALLPWCVGEPHKGLFTLGAHSLESVRRDGAIALHRPELGGNAAGQSNTALYNAATHRSLIAGRLTEFGTSGAFELASIDPKQQEGWGRFRVSVTFDPPVVVQPGDVLESDVIYLGIAEDDPITGLERFVRAFELVNDFRAISAVPAHIWLPDEPGFETPFAHFNRAQELTARPPRPIDLFVRYPPMEWRWTSGPSEASAIVGVIGDTRVGGEMRAIASPLPDTRRTGRQSDHAFDLINERYLGVSSPQQPITVDARVDQLLKFTPVAAMPTIIAQFPNPFAPIDVEWDGTSLTGAFTHTGEPTYRLYAAVPASYELGDTQCSDAAAKAALNDGILRIEFVPSGAELIAWSVSFDRRPQSD